MSLLFLDIETVPNAEAIRLGEGLTGSDREVIQAYAAQLDPGYSPGLVSRPFFPLPYHLPVVICALHIAPTPPVRAVALFWCPGSAKRREGLREMLAAFWLKARGGERPTLVTWNGRGFDLPVLELCGLAHDAEWRPRWFRDPRGLKAWEDPRHRLSGVHVDLMDYLANYGAARRMSLRSVAAALGVTPKSDAYAGDPEAIERDWRDGAGERLIEYCATDVIVLAEIWRRVFGGIPDLPPPSVWAESVRIFGPGSENVARPVIG